MTAKIVIEPRMDRAQQYAKYVIESRIQLQGEEHSRAFFGYGNNIVECWLDMFVSFKEEHPNVFVTNGKLSNFAIRKTF